MNPNAEPFPQWVRDTWQRVRPFSTGRTYTNFQTADEDSERIRATYGLNYDRLVEVKKTYDPSNQFHSNRDILPSPGRAVMKVDAQPRATSFTSPTTFERLAAVKVAGSDQHFPAKPEHRARVSAALIYLVDSLAGLAGSDAAASSSSASAPAKSSAKATRAAGKNSRGSRGEFSVVVDTSGISRRPGVLFLDTEIVVTASGRRSRHDPRHRWCTSTRSCRRISENTKVSHATITRRTENVAQAPGT